MHVCVCTWAHACTLSVIMGNDHMGNELDNGMFLAFDRMFFLTSVFSHLLDRLFSYKSKTKSHKWNPEKSESDTLQIHLTKFPSKIRANPNLSKVFLKKYSVDFI